MRNTCKEKKASVYLFIACWIVYAVVSMTKSAFATAIASILKEGLFAKPEAGLISAGFYLFYGGAQLVGLKLIDKISPTGMITTTLIGTAVAMVGMACSNSFALMLFFWCFCGLIQFAIWPAVLRLIAEYLHAEHEGIARIYIAFSYCTGTLLNYLIAAALLKVARWTSIFWTFTCVVTVCLIVWLLISHRTVPVLLAYRERYCETKNEIKRGAPQTPHSTMKLLVSSGLILLLVPAVLRCALDTGLKSWVPTMIVENYDVSISFASVLTTVLICINLTGAFIATFFYPKRIKNATLAFSLCFLVSIPFMVLLLWIGKIHVALVVLFLTIITTMMYAGHQLINVIIPSHFAKMGKTGSVSAILNAFASFGAVIASFAFGYIAENYGWSATTASWIVIAAVACLFSLVAAPRWKRFSKEVFDEKHSSAR